MTEMLEPDRTIMIVSIIGLVVIWGSFFYHRYLQDGDTRREHDGHDGDEADVGKEALQAPDQSEQVQEPSGPKDRPSERQNRRPGSKRGKKRKR